jgi:hypothetical protein
MEKFLSQTQIRSNCNSHKFEKNFSRERKKFLTGEKKISHGREKKFSRERKKILTGEKKFLTGEKKFLTGEKK